MSLPTLPLEPDMTDVVNLPLRKTALAIARQYGAEGAIIILKLSDDDVFRTAVSGLTDDDIRNGLYLSIHNHVVMMDMDADEVDL